MVGTCGRRRWLRAMHRQRRRAGALVGFEVVLSFSLSSRRALHWRGRCTDDGVSRRPHRMACPTAFHIASRAERPVRRCFQACPTHEAAGVRPVTSLQRKETLSQLVQPVVLFFPAAAPGCADFQGGAVGSSAASECTSGVHDGADHAPLGRTRRPVNFFNPPVPAPPGGCCDGRRPGTRPRRSRSTPGTTAGWCAAGW